MLNKIKLTQEDKPLSEFIKIDQFMKNKEDISIKQGVLRDRYENFISQLREILNHKVNLWKELLP